MTQKEKQKAIDALKISAPVRVMTQEEFSDYIKTLNKIMDWLEQEPIIDKIRAEIWDLQYGDEEKSMTDEDRADAYNNAIKQVIEIIDKYKAESEK